MREIKIRTKQDSVTHPKGKKRLQKIHQSALDLVIENGYHSLTLRQVASGAGISVGNLYYYYSDKETLLRDLLDSVIEGYIEEFDTICDDVGEDAEGQFVAVIKFIIEDLGTKETSYFFPELWSLANHNSYIAERVDELYYRARIILNNLIAIINPALTKSEREQVALFISASMEGLTPFVGFKKPWARKRAKISNIAAISFLNLIKTISSEDIAGMTLQELRQPS